jgi:hypothetical protein
MAQCLISSARGKLYLKFVHSYKFTFIEQITRNFLIVLDSYMVDELAADSTC